MLGLNELHLLARIRVCTDGGLNVTIAWKTVHPVKAQHETCCRHLPTDKQTDRQMPLTATQLLCVGVRVPWMWAAWAQVRDWRAPFLSQNWREPAQTRGQAADTEVAARLRCTWMRRSDVSIETQTRTHRYLVGGAHIEDGEDVRHHAGFE